MATKMELLNLVEEAGCGNNTQEFIELLANQYKLVSEYMESDQNFKESFQMSCVKLSNSSSYMYQFLGGLKLVGEDRPTSFATIMNLLHIVVSPKKHNRMTAGFLTKVILMFFYLIMGTQAGEFKIETNTEHVLITSNIDTVQYTEISEQFSLEPIFNQISKLNRTLSLIQGLLDFTVENRDCTTLGNLNSNTDNIEELISVAKTRNLTMLRMQTSEKEIEHKYIGYVINDNHQTSCILTNSVANTNYLLAQNTIRNTPDTDREIIDYRDNMLSRFRDNHKRSCIRQGKFPPVFVTRSFAVLTEPRIENCAAECYFMLSNFLNAFRHNSVSSIKQNLTQCEAWSFDINTGYCDLIERISNEDFIGKIDWESEGNLYAMTGVATCQPVEFYKSMPKIFANEKLTNVHEICRFSAERPGSENQLSRCKNLYYELQAPIVKQQTELSLFMENLLEQHKIRKNRKVRSVVLFGLQIAKMLVNAANTLEPSVLHNLMSNVTRTAVERLHSLRAKLNAAGIQSKVVSNQNQKAVSNRPLNIERFLQVAKSWQANYEELQMIKHNYSIFISQLTKSSNDLKKYFLRLFSDERPLKQRTIKFVENQTYIFSSYITEQTVIRQFIKTQESSYNAMQTTLIPITENAFFHSYFWQSDVFQGKSFKHSNQCLRQLMLSMHDENTVEICKAAPKLTSFEKLGENVYSIAQRVKNMTGRIVVTNAKAVFEIRCKKGQLLKFTRGLAIFVISEDCSFTINGQMIIQPKLNVAGFQPSFVFGLNKTLIRPPTKIIDYHKIGNSVITAIFSLVCTIIFIIICIRCSYQRTDVQYNYVAPMPEELQDL